jgi:hypothetical protein
MTARRRLHATETQLGYYRHFRTRHGDVLRLIRMQAGPIEAEPQMPFVRLVNLFLSMTVLWLVVIGWGLSLIGGAS